MSSDTLKIIQKESNMDAVRVRIAPSPTGYLHIGTARTALLNYLFARKHGGVFIVRIEDTDLERSDPKFEDEILESLEWLGIPWDEGPVRGDKTAYKGNYAPYRQSERITLYTPFIQKLLDEEKAYWCYHTEEELEAIKNDQRARKEPERYPGYCRNTEERERLKKRKNPGIIRFMTPSGRMVVFEDIVLGEIKFDSKEIGDFSLAKGLEVPLYNFAVVIDDYAMKISHVIRGADHVSNTPKQILLAEALGIPSPKFAHVPLILGPDGSKLSKRHGATSIREYREQGYVSEALINFMALLGWSAQAKEGGTDQNIFSLDELVRLFSLEKAQKAGAIFDIAKLNFLNSVHMRRLSGEELARRTIPFLVKAGLMQEVEMHKGGTYQIVETGDEIPFEWVVKAVALERAKTLGDIPQAIDFLFRGAVSYQKELLRWKTMKSDDEVLEALTKVEEVLQSIPEGEWTQAVIAQKIKGVAQGPPASQAERGGRGDNGRYFWPMRVALSGREKSPGPQEIAEVLGKTKTLARIEEAKNLLG